MGLKFGSRKLLVCTLVLIVRFFFRFVRFVTFRRVLDAKMQEATRMGVTLKTKGEESSKNSSKGAPQYELKSFVTMATYWVPDLPDINLRLFWPP